MNFSADKQAHQLKKRLDLFAMFYPLERKYERRWAKLFKCEFLTIAQKFREISTEKGYDQEEVNDHIILWKNPPDSVECMFYFVNDVANLKSVSNCFEYIDRFKVFLTYAIVHQKKDGENDYDIFRFSPFSYLEHCNRVRYPLKKRS